MVIVRTLLPILVFLLAGQMGLASVASTFGLSARQVGLSNSGFSLPVGGHSAYYNPASLGFIRSATLDVSFVGSYDQFDQLRNVVIASPQVQENVSLTVGDFDPDQTNVSGLSFGFATPVGEKAGFGISYYMPVNNLVNADTGNLYDPQYLFFGNRLQRFLLEIGAGYQVMKGLSVGVGANLYFGAGATSRLVLNSSAAQHAQFAMDVRPVVAPSIGITFKPAETMPESKIFRADDSIGLTVRLPVDTRMNLDVQSLVSGWFGGIPFQFLVDSSLFYDPLTVEFGGSISAGERLKLLASVTWENWDKYISPFARLNPVTPSGNPATIDDQFKDLWVPRVGFEFYDNDVTLRAGYEYWQSPVPVQSAVNTNILDSNRHIVGFGVGFNLARVLGMKDSVLQMDVGGQYHFLEEVLLQKVNSQAIGAPNYTIGGNVWVYAASISTGL
jgi:long-subunit fatty acid transport protein